MLLKTAGMAIVSVLLATAGQFLLKAGMDRVGYVGADRIKRPVELALTVARSPQVLLGLAFFVVSAGVWLIVLSRVPLSTAYPFAGITYITTALVGRFALHEAIPPMRWLGIFLVVSGIVLVGRSAPDEVQHTLPPPGPASTIR